jgi:hypothetical protein
MKIIYVFIFFVFSGCGPGIKDGSVHISHGYYFTHLGGQQNLIEHIQSDRSEIIIKAKVEDFVLDKDKIYISRFPVEYQNEDGVLKSMISRECEFWVIDLTDNSVLGPFDKRAISWPIEKCQLVKS